ncbi:M23 family metallopeptidase [Methylobacterium sp. E-066]|uniref:M23 family metallopeptidase n=1 Tax=Methylobacterium sp. E-066 TaxID=2836584 RepID=UPI001FBA3570|nr:M23 family metallopeptidase [Methylobacterium sp. E-066]MCJ2144362.1 M23 family metallopeptidase [Methylobacterium sp. E-066]
MRALTLVRAAAILAPLFCGAVRAAETGQSSASTVPVMTPLIADVLTAPRVVPMSDGRNHLVYELRLSNVLDGRFDLKRLVVLDAGSQRPLLALDREAIGQRSSLGGRRGNATASLGAYQFGIVFLHIILRADERIPEALVHEIEGFAEPLKADLSMQIARTPVIDRSLPVLAAPLHGGGYIVGDGCCDSIRHVRALLPLNGALRLAQRYAIDWERIDDEDRIVRGDLKDVRSYRIYGEPVLAVADGTVAGSRNDLPDQVPGALPSNLPIGEADGNFIVMDLGGGAFVLYAHLKPGSVGPGVGDHVRRGDLLGDVGNSGNSQAPHLHLHVMDSPNALLADGLPYVFEAFTNPAAVDAGTADFDHAEATGSPLRLARKTRPSAVRDVLPLDLSIVDWPAPPSKPSKP